MCAQFVICECESHLGRINGSIARAACSQFRNSKIVAIVLVSECALSSEVSNWVIEQDIERRETSSVI